VRVNLLLEGSEFFCEVVVLLPEFRQWVLGVVVCREFFGDEEIGGFAVLHDIEVSAQAFAGLFIL